MNNVTDLFTDEPVLVAGIVSAIVALAAHWGFNLAPDTTAFVTGGVTLGLNALARLLTRPKVKSVPKPTPPAA